MTSCNEICKRLDFLLFFCLQRYNDKGFLLTTQGCQPPRHQILRIDRKGIIVDIVSHDKWRHFVPKKCSLISIDVYSTYNSSYLAIVEEMFHVNSSSNNAKCLKFYRRKVYNSLQEIATLAIIWEISDSNLETMRYSLKSGVSWIIWES